MNLIEFVVCMCVLKLDVNCYQYLYYLHMIVFINFKHKNCM